METPKNTWGGARKGAGRKAEDSVQMTIIVKPETKLKLKELSKEKGISIGKVVDYLISLS